MVTQVSNPACLKTFPCLYRTPMIIEAGPNKIPYTVHQEIFRERSEIATEAAKIIAVQQDLSNKLDELRRVPAAVYCPEEAKHMTSHANCRLVCGILKGILCEFPDPNGPTYGDVRCNLRPVFARILGLDVKAIAEGAEDGTDEGDSVTLQLAITKRLWSMEANDELNAMDSAVQQLREHVESEIAAVKDVARANGVTNEGLQGILAMPNITPRVLEMLIHNLYTDKIEVMASSGQFREPDAMDLVQLSCAASALQIDDLPPHILQMLQSGKLADTGPAHTLAMLEHVNKQSSIDRDL